nr:MAG TPA_asm: hypothetical protein [Caudoviricetes sp.]
MGWIVWCYLQRWRKSLRFTDWGGLRLTPVTLKSDCNF